MERTMRNEIKKMSIKGVVLGPVWKGPGPSECMQ